MVWRHPPATTRVTRRSAPHSHPPPELNSTHPLLQEASQAPTHTWQRHRLKCKHQGLNPKGWGTPHTRRADARDAAFSQPPQTTTRAQILSPPAANGQGSTPTHMAEALAKAHHDSHNPKGRARSRRAAPGVCVCACACVQACTTQEHGCRACMHTSHTPGSRDTCPCVPLSAPSPERHRHARDGPRPSVCVCVCMCAGMHPLSWACPPLTTTHQAAGTHDLECP